jgi:hypothetical protein
VVQALVRAWLQCVVKSELTRPHCCLQPLTFSGARWEATANIKEAHVHAPHLSLVKGIPSNHHSLHKLILTLAPGAHMKTYTNKVHTKLQGSVEDARDSSLAGTKLGRELAHRFGVIDLDTQNQLGIEINAADFSISSTQSNVTILTSTAWANFREDTCL